VGSPRLILGSALIVLVYLGLGLANVFTRAPWCDEGWFGSPAYNLAYKGFMGTTVLDPASSTWKSVKLTGIDRHTYWVMPLNLLLNAAGFRVFGFSIFSMRLISLLWGLLALGAWGAILWKLTGQPLLTLGSLGLIAVDYHFLLQASDGRMDVMTVALGWSGVAAYLWLRERRFPLAVAVSQTLAAMAFFTHPNGVMLVLILACTTICFDRRRVRIPVLAIAAIPYLAIGAGWALYITQSPADFVAQFLGNAADRGPTITAPLAALRLEISHRYVDNYGLAAWSSLSGRLNAIPLAIFLAGAAACLLVREIRQHPAYRLLLAWTLFVVFFLTEMEGLKTHFYLIYLTPLYSILLAAAAAWAWRRHPRWRCATVAVLLVFVALQAVRTPVAVSRNPRRGTYDPAVRYLQSRFNRNTFIMGGAGLIFSLGPDWNILDDFRLGYDSGKRAEVVVIDPSWMDRIGMLQTERPPIYAFVTRLLKTEYREVYNQGGYRILMRDPNGPNGSE
jgi:4-amino-4-deoxy-L-arabinose transferase-like glycosyltransferase